MIGTADVENETRFKVLVVEDEHETRELIREVLSFRFEVHTASDGEEGLRVARSQLPDLILLDINMPRGDGLSICERLRNDEVTRHIPVIMVTGMGDTDYKVEAFTNGADDYIAKPFKPRELLARVSSKIRRVEERAPKRQTLSCGNVALNLEKMEVLVADRSVTLSVLEFELLKYFVQNCDKVLSREKILGAVWRDCVVSDRTVDTHVVSLRKKIKGADHVLSTVYGAGYILKRDDEADKPLQRTGA